MIQNSSPSIIFSEKIDKVVDLEMIEEENDAQKFNKIATQFKETCKNECEKNYVEYSMKYHGMTRIACLKLK